MYICLYIYVVIMIVSCIVIMTIVFIVITYYYYYYHYHYSPRRGPAARPPARRHLAGAADARAKKRELDK